MIVSFNNKHYLCTKIELYNHEEGFGYFLGVRIMIDGEEIDSSVKYEIEL